MKTLTLKRILKTVWQTRRRTVAAVMLPIYFVTSLPTSVLAQGPQNNKFVPPTPVLTQKNVKVNRVESNQHPYAGVKLPSQPTDLDITLSHAFAEPLLPVGGKTTSAENRALSAAILEFLKGGKDESFTALTNFIGQYPNSPWRASLDLNLGEIYYSTGYFSRALDVWQDAWDRTQKLTDPTGQKVGNLAVAKLAKMQARIGRMTELDNLFKQIKGRSISGQAANLLVEARSGLWLMHNCPEDAFRCGPAALQEIAVATKGKLSQPELIKKSRSTTRGISMPDVQKLSAQLDMPMQMAKRSLGAQFIIPAVIHWKLGHYAALVGQKNGRYEVHDVTFGGKHFLVSAKALESETSGYFLVPTGPLPSGWTSVEPSEGKEVFGRGNTAFCDPGFLGPLGPPIPDDGGTGGPPGDCGNPPPQYDPNMPQADPNVPSGGTDLPYDADSFPAMTISSVSAMLVSLNLQDTPVRDNPPVGPAMRFTVEYNQRENTQPTTFTYANLGPNWTFNYLSYVTPTRDNSGNIISGSPTVYERGGGVETYIFTYNSTTNTGVSIPNTVTQSILSYSAATNTWLRTLPNGQIETFAEEAGGLFFLSQITDPQGNSMTLGYDANFRLTSLTDALGQVSTITYASNTSTNLPTFYLITKVTDPFGRYAQFDYDATFRLLRITDILGITSQFTYLSSNFITSLTTPYGLTSFAYGDLTTDPTLGTSRWLETTYPDGNKTRVEYCQNALNISNSDSPGIPVGMYPGITATNDYMQYRNTYYWDKQAMKDHPGDYTKAQVAHWLHTSDITTTSGIEESHKKIDQNRIWFAYGDPSGGGQMSSYQASDTMIAKPTQRGRFLDDGSSQVFNYQYNTIGNTTQSIDPTGRETDYTYDTNNIDLLTVKQKTGSSTSDLLATYTYNALHEPLTFKDVSGKTTTNTYYTNGKLSTVTNAKGQLTTYNYDSNYYLTSVTGPVSGAVTHFTYDGYGRVQTVKDSQGFVTTYNYDPMDRVTLVTYPDGTTSQVNYQNLDPIYTKDRLGRWTRTFYNSLRQPVAVMDSMGHVTNSFWTLSAGLDSIIDPAGHVTKWKHDDQNRVTEKDYPDGKSELISYEASTSRVKTTTDPMGQVATKTYNLDNTVEQVAYTHATIATPSVSYTYDTLYPRVLTMVDGTGTTTYNYNHVTTPPALGTNAISSVVTPLDTIAYSYDELGRQLTQTVGSATPTSTTYDTLGRISNVSNALTGTGASFFYSYLNNTGQVTSIANPNGFSQNFTYQNSTDTPGTTSPAHEPWLTQIKNNISSSSNLSQFDYGYDAAGQITSWTQTSSGYDPQAWTMQYDNEGELLNVTSTDTSTTMVSHQYGYTYDAAGNRKTEQIDGTVNTSSYNNLNQLTGVSAGGAMTFSGSLDKPATVTVAGNAAVVDGAHHFQGTASVTTGTNNVPIIATNLNGYATTNIFQVVVPSTSGSYTYDFNGNLISDGSRTFYWDAKNQLVGIAYSSGAYSGTHTEFTYNGAGQRVKITECTGTTFGSGSATSIKQFIGNEERDGSNVTTRRYYAQGEQRIASGVATNYYYFRDHLGSIREMVDGTGNIQARYAYDPYGRRTKVSGTLDCDFGFTGHYWHGNSGLYLAPYRAYDPNLGRWISRDISESLGLNLYTYCEGSPLCKVDPSGHVGVLLVGVVIVSSVVIAAVALRVQLYYSGDYAHTFPGIPITLHEKAYNDLTPEGQHIIDAHENVHQNQSFGGESEAEDEIPAYKAQIDAANATMETPGVSYLGYADAAGLKGQAYTELSKYDPEHPYPESPNSPHMNCIDDPPSLPQTPAELVY